VIVLDTHVLIWWIGGGRKLSARARREMKNAMPESPAEVSAISALEIATAVRRGRLDLGMPVEEWFADLNKLPEVRFRPVSAAMAQLAGSFDPSAPADPADRLIAATAIVLGATLITADDKLRGFPPVRTAW